jgi:hypothetical protein
MDGTSTEQSAMAAKRADLDMKNLLGAMLTIQNKTSRSMLAARE